MPSKGAGFVKQSSFSQNEKTFVKMGTLSKVSNNPFTALEEIDKKSEEDYFVHTPPKSKTPLKSSFKLRDLILSRGIEKILQIKDNTSNPNSSPDPKNASIKEVKFTFFLLWGGGGGVEVT